MKKTLLLLFIASIYATALIPASALAVWWNPLTWKMFNSTKNQPVQIEQLPTPDIEPQIKKTEPVVSTTSASTKPVTAIPVKVPESVQQTVSADDRSQITSVIYGFLISISKKDGVTANSYVSNKSKIYFDSLFNLARTSAKEELLKKDFSTIATVLLIRIAAASSTLEITSSDVITQAVKMGTSTWMNSPNFYDLGLTFESKGPNTVFVTSKSLGQVSIGLTLIKENNSWKVDYATTISEQSAEIERQLAKTIRESGESRDEVMQMLLQLFFGRSNTELDYLLWIPLNERGELKSENAKLKTLMDPANGWSILYPDHWAIEYLESTTFFFAPYTTDGIRPSVAITPNHNPQNANLDKYIDYILEELPKVKKDLTGEVESKKITFLGKPAYQVKYNRLRTFDDGRTYIKQTTDSIIVMNDGRAYLIEYRNGIADFPKSKPLADKIIETFRFEELCTKNCIIQSRN